MREGKKKGEEQEKVNILKWSVGGRRREREMWGKRDGEKSGGKQGGITSRETKRMRERGMRESMRE